MGLVSPGRSAGRGRGRRYSLRDVLVLREVQRLSQAGVSLSGIKRIMELEGELDQYRAALTEMAAEMAQLRTELESTRAVAARLAGLLRSRGAGGTLVPVRDGRTGGRPQRRHRPPPGPGRPHARRGRTCQLPERQAIRRRNPHDGRLVRPPSNSPH